MNSKYVIKNCPAIYGIFLDGCKKDHYEDGTVLCKDCTSCVMKQIVELCKKDKNFCINCKTKADDDIDCVECIEGGKAELGTEILKLLDIYEVE